MRQLPRRAKAGKVANETQGRGKFVAMNQFGFSLTNHANMGLIMVWGPKDEEEEEGRVRGEEGGHREDAGRTTCI